MSRYPGSPAWASDVYKRQEPLEQSTQMAMDAVRDLILKNRDNQDKYKGIPLEQFLEELP